MIELYLNDRRIELLDTKISLTKQINNFAELKDRQATFTNKFKIPMTPKNMRTFEYLGIHGNITRLAYQNISANLIIDSVPVIVGGSAKIQSIKGGYNVTIYSGNIHLFEKLGDKKITDLPLTDLDHDLTTTNFTGSFSHDYTDGYVYALSDFGVFDTSKILVNYQMPSFYIRYLWELIFEEAGYTQDFDVESDLVMTPKRGYNGEGDVGVAASISASASTDYIDDTDVWEEVEVEVPQTYEPDSSSGHITLDGGKFTVTDSGLHYIDIDTTINDGWAFMTSMSLIVKKNGIKVSETLVANLANQLPVSVSRTIPLIIGDEITIFYKLTYYNGRDEDTYGNPILTSAEIDFDSDIDFYTVVGGAGIYVNVGTFIGEMTQADFIKDIMQHYCLLSQKTKDENDVQFIKASTMLSEDDVADWSDRFVRVINEDYSLSYAQNNYFKYNYAEANEDGTMDGVLKIRNTSLTPNSEHLTRPYNAVNRMSKTLLNSSLITSTPFWESERDDTGAVTGYKVLEGKNYLARVDSNSETISYGLDSGFTLTHTGNVPRLSNENLSYQYLLDNNYEEVKEMLDWNKVLDVELKMDIIDFDSFDFFDLIFIKQLGGNYYVNKIKYNGGATMQCQIVFVPQT